MSDDLLRSSSKAQHLGSVRWSAFIGFTAGFRQIAGQATLLRLRQNPRQSGDSPLALVLVLLFMRDGPSDTKRDLGAGPRSVVGVRVPTEVGPNREFRPLVTWGWSGIPVFK